MFYEEKYSLLYENFGKLQEKNELLEKEVSLLKEKKQYEELFHQEENKNQKFSMELYLKNEMLSKREDKLKYFFIFFGIKSPFFKGKHYKLL